MTTMYRTPLAFKTAIEHRLRNWSQDSGKDLVRLRQLVVFDRFLARVFSVFDDALLKGGLVLEFRIDRARATRDIDLRLSGSPDKLLADLQQAGRLDLGDFFTFDVQPHPLHPTIQADGMRYEGRRFRIEARLADKLYGAPFVVDVATAEPFAGEPELIDGIDFFAFAEIPPTPMRAYSLETHIAEKLHAYTLPRQRPNSRVKDLPDIALLASIKSIQGNALADAIQQTFAIRATHDVPTATPAPPRSWSEAYARLANINTLPWPTLEQLADHVSRFLDPVLRDDPGIWDPQSWTWSTD